MGYTTDFSGSLSFDKPLTANQITYIQSFNGIRHMNRDEEIVKTFKDPIREAVGLPIGKGGEYYVGSIADGQCGQKDDGSILDYNGMAEKALPGLWCKWTVSDDGTELLWDEGEKFYNYVEWLQYLIKNFFDVWGYKLTGEISWYGEDREDMGIIEVADSVVTVKNGKIIYE